jgi:hypothetical protein
MPRVALADGEALHLLAVGQVGIEQPRPGRAARRLGEGEVHHVVIGVVEQQQGWTRLLDTNLPDSQEVESFAVGESYSVTGRSMLMFVLKPVENEDEDEEHSDMERSYQYVMQAFERPEAERKIGLREEHRVRSAEAPEPIEIGRGRLRRAAPRPCHQASSSMPKLTLSTFGDAPAVPAASHDLSRRGFA